MEKKEVLYNHTVSYRITGPQSIQRLDPLLKSIKGFDWKEANSSISSLHFVWETSCKKTERNQHAGSIVCNRLHNSQIIEDKSNLAFLQIQMATVGNSAVLETFVTRNLAGACDWFNSRWCQMSTDGKTCGLLHETGDTILDNECSSTSYRLSHSVPRDSDWWIVKASKGNGGRDVWVVHPNNYIDVLSQLSPNEEYVIQRYIKDPLLLKGHKFHFRMYAILQGNMRTFLYEKAFLLSAGLKYDCNSDDVNKHITNLSVNKKLSEHPGQIPVNVKEAYPAVFEGATRLWDSLITAALPFLSHQRSADHFEFFGLDIIPDQYGNCWLIEVNRLPGLESSSANEIEENLLYDEMMLSLLRIVTEPLRNVLPPRVPPAAVGQTEIYTEAPPSSEDNHSDPMIPMIKGEHGFWMQVHGPSPVTFGTKDLWKNLLNWRAFTHKNRLKVLV